MGILSRFLSACVALILITPPSSPADESRFDWNLLPDLPPASEGTEQKGLAGLFGGVHNGVVILAGGANFPDAAPWKSGVKTFWNDIYVLEKDAKGKASWVSGIKAKLPKPMAYGSSVSTENGVLCIGGADATQCYSDVFLLKWNAESREVEIENLPALPITLAHAAASKVGDIVYVAGGVPGPFEEGTHSFFALDLEPEPEPQPESSPGKGDSPADETGPTPDTKNPEPASVIGDAPTSSETEKEKDATASGDPGTGGSKDGEPTRDGQGKAGVEEPAPIKPEVIDDDPEDVEKESGAAPGENSEPAKAPLLWTKLAPWDGGPRAFATSAAQSDGEKECFFLFSGRNPRPDGTSKHLFDAHKYDPEADLWVKFPDIAIPDSPPRSVVAASAIAHGDRSIIIFGGDDGTMAKVSALVVAAANSTSKDAYLKLNETILENHPGYSRDVLALDVVDGIWTNADTFPESCPVTTPAILWDDSLIIPSGEIRPGVRSVKIWKGTWKSG